jgi:hypothetical protein
VHSDQHLGYAAYLAHDECQVLLVIEGVAVQAQFELAQRGWDA